MPDLPDVLNWRRRCENVTLSGQPTEAQLAKIRDLGVTHVINLAPHTNTGSLPDETTSIEALGLSYIHIPVDFQDPTEQDYADFRAALAKTESAMVHVHCIYNARVSAFFYRLAKDGHGGNVSDAHALMDSIWRPGGVWASFIGDAASEPLPHRYAGEDY